MIRVRENQSIFDITVQEFGQIDDVVRVSSDNNLSISDALETNRELIMNASGYGNNDIKKKIIEQGLSLNNDVVYSERKIFGLWHLPSEDELNQMYVNLKVYGVGGFTNGSYWTSTEHTGANPDINAHYQRFSDGVQGNQNKANSLYTRACRSFTTAIGVYSLRDVGPGGGLIFHISGTIYYEAAPSDQSTGKFWSNINDIEIGISAQGTAIGTGAANTLAIINQAGGADDWFLPSENELNEMYVNLHVFGVGNFTESYYWSSSEDNSDHASMQSFIAALPGYQYSSYKTGVTREVRACRSFTAGIGEYSLRDTGPAGGLIFYISGTTYYESYWVDQGLTEWSNIGNVLIGTTSTVIGEGQNNTNEIIVQPGHTTSAAKDCDDLSTSYSCTDGAAKICNDLN